MAIIRPSRDFKPITDLIEEPLNLEEYDEVDTNLPPKKDVSTNLWQARYEALWLDYQDLCKKMSELRTVGLRDRQRWNTLEVGGLAADIEMKLCGTVNVEF